MQPGYGGQQMMVQPQATEVQQQPMAAEAEPAIEPTYNAPTLPAGPPQYQNVGTNYNPTDPVLQPWVSLMSAQEAFADRVDRAPPPQTYPADPHVFVPPRAPEMPNRDMMPLRPEDPFLPQNGPQPQNAALPPRSDPVPPERPRPEPLALPPHPPRVEPVRVHRKPVTCVSLSYFGCL
jgi:hypothetical protein